MKGNIKTFIAEKGFGFIRGEDDKDYFFHKSAFANKEQIQKLCEELEISFNPEETPKGLQAINCELLDLSDVDTYVVPDDLITSRSNGVKGWSVLEAGNWMVHGSSAESSDAAKADLVEKAAKTGANTLINVEYYKTKKFFSENGIPFATIHHFKGRPVVLAKRNAKASLKKEDLIGLSDEIVALKSKLVKLTKTSRFKRNLVWLSVIAASAYLWTVQPWAIIPVVLLGIIFGRSKNQDSWLQKL